MIHLHMPAAHRAAGFFFIRDNYRPSLMLAISEDRPVATGRNRQKPAKSGHRAPTRLSRWVLLPHENVRARQP